MSCHGTPGNRAVTSLACALTHTPSDEVSRRFHDLKREGEQEAGPPSEVQVNEWLERQMTAVRTDEGLSAWRRERLLTRLQEARDEAASGTLPGAGTWHAWQNLRAACDDAHTHQWLAAQTGMTLPLSETEPADIDERLGDIWRDIDVERVRRKILMRDIQRAEADLARGRYGVTEDDLNRRRLALADCENRIEKLLDQTAPYEAEFRRRGGWSRYYRVVTNGQGHVHSSMSCHSCYPTTQYVWLPTLSGKGQDEAVDEYGSEMCSHCFPDVVGHPSYQTRGRVAEEVAAARAAERAERDAVKVAKGITAPDGSPLRIGTSARWPETIASEVTAERTLVTKMTESRRRLSAAGIDAEVRQHEARGWGRDPQDYRRLLEEQAEEVRGDIDVLTAALAHKRGVSVQDVLASVEDKVSKRVAKEDREAARWRAEQAQQQDD